MPDFHETTVRVRYAETDQMGVVYHANYYVWFELGRTEMLRATGINYKEMESRDDCYIVVAESSCRYLRPARYDDVLRIRTRIVEAKPRILRIAYEVVNEAAAELLATGQTVHVICDKEGRTRSLPARYRALFGIPEAAATPAAS
jgi:acyl-CoA thioester hydrolase